MTGRRVGLQMNQMRVPKMKLMMKLTMKTEDKINKNDDEQVEKEIIDDANGGIVLLG